MKKKPYIIPEERITWRMMDQEAVILNIEKDVYYSLNETGARVWVLLNEGLDTEAINDAVAREYGIVKSRAAKDVKGIIGMLIEEGLLIRNEPHA